MSLTVAGITKTTKRFGSNSACLHPKSSRNNKRCYEEKTVLDHWIVCFLPDRFSLGRRCPNQAAPSARRFLALDLYDAGRHHRPSKIAFVSRGRKTDRHGKLSRRYRSADHQFSFKRRPT